MRRHPDPRAAWVKTADVVNGTLWQCFPVINVDRVKDIPSDYPGAMGVPITYLDRHDPNRFEIVGRRGHLRLPGGRECYQRIFIRNLHPDLPEVIDLVAWFGRMGVPLDFAWPEEATGGEEIRPEYRGKGGTEHA